MTGIALASLLAFAAAAPASADPTPSAPEFNPERKVVDGPDSFNPGHGVPAGYRELMRVQEELNDLAGRIRAHAKDRAGAGLAGVVVDPKTRTLDLYWRGRMFPAVSKDVAGARQRGVAVNIHKAAYTFTQLDAEAARLAKQHFGSKGATAAVVSVVPKHDGSGLEVGVTGVSADSASFRHLAVALDSTVPLKITAAPQPIPATRWHDFSPYWGGSYMVRQLDGRAINSCTSGFGVEGNNLAATYILTAAHCGESTGPRWRWATGSAVYPDGSIRQNEIGDTIPTRDPGHDAQLILTGAGDSVYFGASWWDGDTFEGRTVFGAVRNEIGNLVCTSGSYSGTVCGGIRIAATNERLEFDPPVNGVGVITNLIRAELPGVGIAGNGDSGGPVFSLRSTDLRVGARGTISAIPGCNLPPGGSNCSPDNWITCRGVPNDPDTDPNGRHCSWRMWYPDIGAQMRTLGVHLNVG